MKKLSLSLILFLASSMVFATEKADKVRKPSSENFTSHIGAIQVNASPGETSAIFIKGDAAKALYMTMTAAKAVAVNKNNIIDTKGGAAFTCNHIKKADGGTNDGYECIADFNSSGGFVD